MGTARSLLLPTIWALVACTGSPGVDMARMKERLAERIALAPAGAEVGLAFEELDTGDTLLINARTQMHAASTMKVPVMIAVFKQAQSGRFALSDSITVGNSFRSIVDGSSFAMDISEDSDSAIYDLIGKQATIYDLTWQMIAVSGNLATNNLLELVGAKNVMATLEAMGIMDMQVLRGVEDLKAYRAGLSNTTNAVDMMRVMSAIARDAVVSPKACAEMRRILLAQEFRQKIPALLPPEVQVANKTGSITRIDHDCALVYLPDGRSYSLTILTRGIDDHDAAARLIAELSRIVYDAVISS